MTARHQFRIGNRRLGRDRAAIGATPAPPVGETLQLARERKGVDLYRAERDTKIRLRYLSALEDGAYDELPAPVYTKGFLRNYAIYLGLEPDDILDRWRDEMEAMRTATRVAVEAPPMPLVEPGGRRLTITPNMLVAALVGLVVIAFVAFLGVQFLRFIEVTELELTHPADRVSEVDATQITLAGTSGPGSLIRITGPGGQLFNTNADQEGVWAREVPLARGRNDFAIVATDPVTQRESTPVQLTITVPLPSPSPGAPVATAKAAPPAAIALELTSPADGFVSSDGQVTVSGTTTGTRVTIGSTYLGAPGATPRPSPAPTPEGSPDASLAPDPIGPAVDLNVSAPGTFSETLEFDPGEWQIVVTAFATEQAPLTRELDITVEATAASGIELVIQVEERDSWVRVVADGVRVPGYGSRTLRAGETHTVNAVDEMCLRAGNAGALHLIMNGEDAGFLGRPGEVGSWVLRPGAAPEPAPAPCT